MPAGAILSGSMTTSLKRPLPALLDHQIRHWIGIGAIPGCDLSVVGEWVSTKRRSDFREQAQAKQVFLEPLLQVVQGSRIVGGTRVIGHVLVSPEPALSNLLSPVRSCRVLPDQRIRRQNCQAMHYCLAN
jgi:hypothetical protein